MFEKMSKALTREDIAEIEVNLGLAFPEDFVEQVQVFLPLKYHYCDIPIDDLLFSLCK